MVVYTYQGSFVPSALAEQLGAAEISCEGVTATLDADANVTAVQVVCSDGTDQAAVDSAVAAYAAPPAPAPRGPAPTPADVAAQMAQTISSAVKGVPSNGTVSDLQTAIVNALAPYA